MKSILRQPVAFAAGFVATLFLGFAALAQTPSASAAKQDDSVPPFFAKLSRLPFGPGSRSFAPRPRGCFCDEDCYAAMLERERVLQRSQPIFKWKPDDVKWRFDLQPSALPKFKWQPLPQSDNEIRAIDLEGLKKVLQRDPNDKRPLLLNFWATWCDPCREEFPDLVKLDADYKNKGLNFIAISVDDISDIKSEVPKFLNQMKATMPVLLLNMNDPEPAIKFIDPTWGGDMPATFLYDKDGRVVFKHFGKIKPDELRAAIDKEIKK